MAELYNDDDSVPVRCEPWGDKKTVQNYRDMLYCVWRRPSDSRG